MIVPPSFRRLTHGLFRHHPSFLSKTEERESFVIVALSANESVQERKANQKELSDCAFLMQEAFRLPIIRPLQTEEDKAAAMVEKRKARNETIIKHKRNKMRKDTKKPRSETTESSRPKGDRRKRSGPRLPAFLRKVVDIEDRATSHREDDEILDSDEGQAGGDMYEYVEDVAQEDSKKNRRFDPVKNYEYELPEDFEDEEVPSDDDGKDGERRARMQQAVTRMPSEAFAGRKMKNNLVVSEAYPESEYNPTSDILDGSGQISIHDLLDPLREKAGYSNLRKRMQEVESKGISVQAPLPKAEQNRLEREAAYEWTKKDITKWEVPIKRNREAPSIFFDENIDVGFSTVGAIAAEFKPRTDFEKAIASFVQDDEVMEAHKKDGARILELNKVSIEEVKDRQNTLSKLRSLLFRHELKAKHIKRIKSKTYRRLKKKDGVKAMSIDLQADPKAARELARKQEFKRAEERMTLRHKNSSKWAKRIMKRGLDAQDEGTRVAIFEQLHEHATLTRKINSMKDSSSSSDEATDEDDDNVTGSDQDRASKLLVKAKEKTMALMAQEEEIPQTGVLSLPFMVRGLEKRKDAAFREAELALQEYESLLKDQGDKKGKNCLQEDVASGRRVFGGNNKPVQESNSKLTLDTDNFDSDSEADIGTSQNVLIGQAKSNDLSNDVVVDLNVFREDSEAAHDSMFESIDAVAENPGPKIAYDVAIFASGSWKKMNSTNKGDADENTNNDDNVVVTEPTRGTQLGEEVSEEIDTDGEGQMIDGILSLGTQETYELPSQEELIRLAFKAKQEILNEENPEPEKPVLLPGWGQWTDVQKKRGLPSWIQEEYGNSKRKRDEALKKRKDAHLNHVIISEKVDKKAEKLYSQTLPYPFTSKEVFEQSIRMPIGPEFNPTAAVRALNRPEVVKKPGMIIKPIKYEELDPHERAEEHKDSGGSKRSRKSRDRGKTTSNNMKRKEKTT
ncbi:hypothetical protein Nepgr_032982 [Nepenthes gracilis]|uniref:U3 small nucleolar RNA-associated protein 14 n=1 Tax=Nepenthes gracilis TaxID=150966 RepID=A0AAD3Y8B8_NEPGR|nr:hypothetical protein Nepgr_032982 [Nepenthes gracilis]